MLPISYYFFSLITRDRQLQNSIKCREVGAKVYAEDMKEWYENESSDSSRYSVKDPEFSYVKSLRSCLYSGGYTMYFYQKEGEQEGHDNVMRVIKDVYTNKVLASTYTGFYDVDDWNFNEEKIKHNEEYNKLYSEYFN